MKDGLKEVVRDVQIMEKNITRIDEEFDVFEERLDDQNSKIYELRNDFELLKYDFRLASVDASEWRYETENRLETIESNLGQTTTQPDIEPTQPPQTCPLVYFSYPSFTDHE